MSFARPPKLQLPCALVLGLACACQGPTSDPAHVVRGPLSTRQQHPISLTLMAFRPRRPVTQPKGELAQGFQLAWSSIEEVAQTSTGNTTDRVDVDAETLRATYRSRYGLDDHLDIEFEIPFLYAGGGVMDSVIESYHNFFGLPQGGRDQIANDRFEASVTANGDTLYDLKGNTIGLEDVPLFLTYQVLEEGENVPAVATRVGLELPTGSQADGFGNGAIDYGASVLAEKSYGRWTLSGGVDYVVPGQSDRMKKAVGHRYERLWALEFGTEYRWNDHCSLVAENVWTSPFLDSIDLEEIDSAIDDLGVGMILDIGATSRFFISVHEDLVAATGSDITLQTGWTWGY